MNISLGNAARSMPQKSGDRQLRVAEAACHAGEGVTQNVRRHVLYASSLANAIEHAHDTDEMAFPQSAGKKNFEASRGACELDSLQNIIRISKDKEV